MNRAEMVEKVWHVLNSDGMEELHCDHLADAVIAAILTQVSTVAEIKAVPVGTLMLSEREHKMVTRRWLDHEGISYSFNIGGLDYSAEEISAKYSPLTVVFQP